MATNVFTENWLQALMQAASNASARRIRPWMTDLSALCAVGLTDGQCDAAKRIWDYGKNHGLIGLLSQIPVRETHWRFEDDECFRFLRPSVAPLLVSEQEFIASLGLVPTEIPLKGSVTQSDWTNLLRREAVRRSKPLNVQSIPTGSSVEVDCVGGWDTNAWSIRFLQPDWLVLPRSGVVETARPSPSVIEGLILDGISFANQHFKMSNKPTSRTPSDAPWMTSIESLYTWHRAVLLTNDTGASPWFRRVWGCVWPVIYRERNRLRGNCDLQSLRGEVAECFETMPQLTEWMFLFARLVCELQFERGLGIAGDFVDRDECRT
jgi:hypothetical protein